MPPKTKNTTNERQIADETPNDILGEEKSEDQSIDQSEESLASEIAQQDAIHKKQVANECKSSLLSSEQSVSEIVQPNEQESKSVMINTRRKSIALVDTPGKIGIESHPESENKSLLLD